MWVIIQHGNHFILARLVGEYGNPIIQHVRPLNVEPELQNQEVPMQLKAGYGGWTRTMARTGSE